MNRAATLLAALALAGVTACSGGATRARTPGGDHDTTSSTRPVATTPSTVVPAPPPSSPARPLSGLTSRLELPADVRAGGRVTGTLVIENGTGAPVELSRACAPKWAVVLTDSPTATPDVPFTMECRVSPPVTLVAGTNRLPFTLSGVVWSCRPPTPTIVPPPSVCPADLHEAPAPGRYLAVLVGLPAVPRPARIEVRVTG